MSAGAGPDNDTQDHAQGDRVLGGAAEAMRAAPAQLGVAASVGVAVPQDDEADAALLARADRALHAVKAGGRDGVALAPDAPARTRSPG